MAVRSFWEELAAALILAGAGGGYAVFATQYVGTVVTGPDLLVIRVNIRKFDCQTIGEPSKPKMLFLTPTQNSFPPITPGGPHQRRTKSHGADYAL